MVRAASPPGRLGVTLHQRWEGLNELSGSWDERWAIVMLHYVSITCDYGSVKMGREPERHSHGPIVTKCWWHGIGGKLADYGGVA